MGVVLEDAEVVDPKVLEAQAHGDGHGVPERFGQHVLGNPFLEHAEVGARH